MLCGSKVMVKTMSMSFFNIIFKAIKALLSCDYFQTIKITSITFHRHVKLIIGTRD